MSVEEFTIQESGEPNVGDINPDFSVHSKDGQIGEVVEGFQTVYIYGPCPAGYDPPIAIVELASPASSAEEAWIKARELFPGVPSYNLMTRTERFTTVVETPAEDGGLPGRNMTFGWGEQYEQDEFEVVLVDPNEPDLLMFGKQDWEW